MAGKAREQMAKKKKTAGDEPSGRESIISTELPPVSDADRNARFEMARQISQELHEVERKFDRRHQERIELKAKLDKVSDDCKSLESRCNAMRKEVVDVIEGRATGRLPFGPGVGADKPVRVSDLKTTPAKLAECYYGGPETLDAIKAEQRPAVNRAIVLPHSDLRFILVDAEHGRHRLIALHPSGWVAPSSAPAMTDLTGKPVEFMDATLVVGTADESPIVLVELPRDDAPAEHGAGGRTDPGGATRGAAVDRAKEALATSIEGLLDILTAGDPPALEKPTDDEAGDTLDELQMLGTVAWLAPTPNPRRWLNVANLDDLERVKGAVESIAASSPEKHAEAGVSIKTRINDGIPPENQDDFADDAQGDQEGTGGPSDDPGDEGDDQEGDDDAQDDAGEPGDAPDDSEAVDEGSDAATARASGRKAARGKGGKAKKAKKGGRR